MLVKKIYIQEIDDEALSIFEAFKQKEGSEHISTPIGIHVLLEIIKKTKPKRILEVGGGIGALSFAVLKHTSVHIDIFENHPFCIRELKKNLKGYEDRYTILTNYDNFTLPTDSYDLLVADGGNRELLKKIIHNTNFIGRIFIEGNRGEQRKVMRRELRYAHTFIPRTYYDTKKRYKGAHELICSKNQNAFIRHLSYWYWEIVIFKEIKLFLQYRSSLLLKKIKSFFS